MGTTIQKLAYLAQTKTDIRQALTDQGSDVTSEDTFRSYADFVSELSVGAPAGRTLLITNGAIGIAGTAAEA